MKRLLIMISLSLLILGPLRGQGTEEEMGLMDTTEENTTEKKTGWFSNFESRSGGEITMESRGFEGDGNDYTYDFGAGLLARLTHNINFEPITTSFRVVSRVDKVDSERNLIYLEDAWIGFRVWRFQLKSGFQLLNWTATEAFHPADIINSRNFDSNIENAEKFGEPMTSLEIEIPFGTLTGYYMPYYQLPRFPGQRSRLNFITIPASFRGAAPIRIDDNGHESTDDFGHQGAVLLRQSYSGLDLSLHAIDQLSRNYAIGAVDAANFTVSPLYPRLQQYGGTAQLVLGSWVFKTEVGHRIYRDFDTPLKTKYTVFRDGKLTALDKIPEHTVAAGGIEFGWDWGNGSETTLLLEGQHIFGVDRSVRAGLDTFQSDVLFGVRIALNDVSDKNLLVSVIGDLERKEEFLFNLNYNQRITEQWSITTGMRRVYAPQKDTYKAGLENLDKSNQYYLNLSRYF